MNQYGHTVAQAKTQQKENGGSGQEPPHASRARHHSPWLPLSPLVAQFSLRLFDSCEFQMFCSFDFNDKSLIFAACLG